MLTYLQRLSVILSKLQDNTNLSGQSSISVTINILFLEEAGLETGSGALTHYQM
jgi:hypothetical protein